MKYKLILIQKSDGTVGTKLIDADEFEDENAISNFLTPYEKLLDGPFDISIEGDKERFLDAVYVSE